MPKHILLIGGNSGIGLETAKTLVAAGHTVTAAARSSDALQALGIPVQPYDAQNAGSLDLPEQLDGLVYCPGTISLKPFHRLTEEDFLDDIWRYHGLKKICPKYILWPFYPAMFAH